MIRALILCLWLLPRVAHAYIGPGAGFALAGGGLVLVGSIVVVTLGLLFWPVRYALRRRRRLPRTSPAIRKAVIVGFDGLDPQITERLMHAGRMPNFVALAGEGGFSPLATTCPPISPVAWSSFATGTQPGKHGIFDFLGRDERTYAPTLSSTETHAPSRHIDVFGFRIPLRKPTISLLQKSVPFWRILGQHDVQCTVLRVPITYPAEPFAAGALLSAMCVPDLEGTQGTFRLLTSAGHDTVQDPLASAAVQGSGRTERLRFVGVKATGDLLGPPDPFRKDGRPLRIPYVITREENSVSVTLCGQTQVLKPGVFGDWLPIELRCALGQRLRGMCRLRVLSLQPELAIYMSPIVVDPQRPALPISWPRFFAPMLSRMIGRFNTLGLAEDTGALNEGALDEAGFLEQAWANHAEREAMFFRMLARNRDGCLVCVFDATDRIQHMFLRDSGMHVVEETYERMDALLGKIRAQMGNETLLMVLSDHGFKRFERGVNVNVWLRDNGYLVLRDGLHESTGDWLSDVDWTKTRAYALGLGGVYLNVSGREAMGIVQDDEREALARELAAKLSTLKDSDKPAVSRVRLAQDEFKGPYVGDAPDLFVGYADGYRVAWDTARGRVRGALFADNDHAWAGDHCIDPALVPGVLLSNRALKTEAARIIDIAPTLLTLFGVKPPAHMDGVSLA